jgi:bile acid-coenzyme A ligase
MPQLSYGRAMDWLAERDPERLAIVCEAEDESGAAETRTRAELASRSNRLARDLAARGVGEGDLVTIALPNGCAFFEAVLASWKLGATPNPISSRLPEAEQRAIIELASPALVIGAAPGACGDLPSLPAAHEPDPALSDAPLEDVTSNRVRAMTSGGSTGRPKLIIDANPAICDPEQPENRMKPGGRILVPGPLYHSGPFLTAWQSALVGGTVYLRQRFDARRCLACIERERIDWVLFVPTMMQRIWKLPKEEREACDLSSLETVMSSGAASPPWVKRAWIEWLGPEVIWEAYGTTERIGGTLISGEEWLAHPGSVGRPSGGRKVSIRDEDGRPLPPGELGLVYYLPPGGAGSTYHYVGASARRTADGWETLGDLGYLDEDGYLYLTDRETDMIVSGGANVYPAEIEAAIDAFGSVRSSAVIGLPDEDLGQRVHAIVDAPGGLDEAGLLVYLKENLAYDKVPRSFELVEEPLRDDAGKVRRSALRAERIAGAG